MDGPFWTNKVCGLNKMTTNGVSRAAEITGALRDDILRGQYRPGERLPSERDLASRFCANRGAVREALKKLEQLGLADIKPGGVRVVPVEDATLEVLGHLLDLNDFPNVALVNQLFEVLSALIAMSARTAIEKANAAEIKRAREILGQIVDAKDDATKRQAGWHELWTYFNQINQNLVLRLIGNGLRTQFMGRLQGLGVQVILDQETNSKLLTQLDQAIADRDAGVVADVTIAHFNFIREGLIASLSRMPPETTSFRSVSS